MCLYTMELDDAGDDVDGDGVIDGVRRQWFNNNRIICSTTPNYHSLANLWRPEVQISTRMR